MKKLFLKVSIVLLHSYASKAQGNCPPQSVVSQCQTWKNKIYTIQVAGYPSACSLQVSFTYRYCPNFGYQVIIGSIGNITCPEILTAIWPNWPSTVPQNDLPLEALFLQAYRQCADSLFLNKFRADSMAGVEDPHYCDNGGNFTEVRWYNSDCFAICWRFIQGPLGEFLGCQAKTVRCNLERCCEVRRSYCYERNTPPLGLKVTETVIADPGLECSNCWPESCNWPTGGIGTSGSVFEGHTNCYSPCALVGLVGNINNQIIK